MPILNHAYIQLMSMGASKKAQSLIKHNVVIKINFNNVVGYTTVFIQAIVTQVTSYDVLVGGAIYMEYRCHFGLMGGNCIYQP
jgi:hypothetical protein